MSENRVNIECRTNGFEEAQEKVEALASAYDGFPAQVTIRQCHDCVINIYPSQTIINDAGGEEHETDRQ